MAQYVFTMNRVGKVVPPKRVILKDISLSFFPGAKIGVLGLNGSGKSSLLRIMAGVDSQFDGEARPMPNLKLGYLAQEPQLDESLDVRGNVEQGLGEAISLVKDFNAISDRFAEPMDDEEMNQLLERQGELQSAIDACNGWEIERRLEIAADALRLPPWQAAVSHLSGGERRRVALCRLLLSEPDMLLLDEPTNHLDALSVQWLEQFLERFPGTVIAVTHDRYFLDNVAGWILELDRGHGIPWQGNYSSWLEQKEARLQIEAKQESARIKAMQDELEWVRSNPKGRQAKSKARLQRFEELASTEAQARNETNEIYIPPGPRLGDLVVEASGLCKRFGDKILYDDLNFALPPGGIVGVIGPNGAGKTTLFNLVTGLLRPDRGDVRLEEVSITPLAMPERARRGIGYLPQEASVFRQLSVRDNLLMAMQESGYPSGLRRQRLDELIDEFQLGRFCHRLGYQLSGGERRRTEVARALAVGPRGPRYLLLDEPFAGVDPLAVHDLQELILRLRERGVGMLITDHNVRETLSITDRAYILTDGQILAAGDSASVAADPMVQRHYLGEGFRL